MLVSFAGWVAPARSDDPALTQMLPDMRQNVPTQIKIAHDSATGTWRLGFASEVANHGRGYLKITGNGPGNGPMVADQIVQMSDGSTTTVPGIGEMRYVIGGGHQHWHLLDFERYELRSAADPSLTIVKDQKTGFCLADAFTSDICGRNLPQLTTVSEGLAVGGSDVYLGYLEGQYLVLDPTTTPAGDYLLVNRVNPTGALLDADASDNTASVRLSLSWDTAGTPMMNVTNSCPASIDCAAPPPPPPPDPGPPPTETGTTAQTSPQQVVTAPEPKPVPIVPASQFTPASADPPMSRGMAGRLVRRAIQKSTKHAPRGLRTTCKRRSRSTFACSSTWRGRQDERWTGHVRVWYRESTGRLTWFYDLSAQRSASGKRVVRRAVRGSTSAVFVGPDGALFCAVLK